MVSHVDKSAADLIVGVDGNEIKTADEFLGHIESKSPGAQVLVSVIRDGKEIQVPIKLEGSDETLGPPARK